MKNRFRIFARWLLVVCVIATAVAGMVYYKLSTDWKEYFTPEQVASFTKEINETPGFSDTFYSIFDKLNGNCRHKSILEVYISGIFKDNVGTCWFNNAAYPFSSSHSKPLSHPAFTLSFAIKKYSTAEKCFDFSMECEAEALRRSAYYRDSFADIHTTSDTITILQFLIAQNGPSRYKPGGKKLTEQMKEFKARLK